MEKLARNYFFILGGEDNEMVEIKRVLEKKGVPYWQPQAEWGNIRVEADTLPSEAKISQLVFVECRPAWLREGKLPLTPSLAKRGEFLPFTKGEVRRGSPIIIDHHDELRDRPASLLQVLALLKIKPTIRQQIIASIDANFLAKTIEKWPGRKKQIIAIWEKGYRQKFGSLKEYREFKKYCKKLFEEAKKVTPPSLPLSRGGNGLLIIDQAPPSMTMLSAMINLAGLEGCLVAGSLDSENENPCFYHGKAEVVEKLSKLNLYRAYWGKHYFGCRAVPGKFVERVREFSPLARGS